MFVSLYDSPELLQLALASGRIGRWAWDASTGLLSWDDLASRILGTWHTEPTVASLKAAVHPDDRSAWQEAWDRAVQPGGNGFFDCEHRLIRPGDGGLRWVTVTGRAEMRDGRPVRIVGVLRNVTERRLAAAAIEEAAARLTGIVTIAADAIISIDEHQLITLFNDGAEVIFGYKRAEVIGRPLYTLIPLRFQDAHSAHIRAFATSSTPSRRMGERGQILAQRKSGEVFPAEASISRIEVGGKPIFTAVLRDVSESKHAQSLLEQRVEAATRELRLEMHRREQSQAQLVRTQRMEAFGQLTGGIAHDFNNLLAVIIGNLELLEMRLDDPKSRLLLQRAQDAAGMGARLTGRLLTFARRRHFAAAPLNVNAVVIGMAEILERALGEQIVLATSLERAPWTIAADASEVENAILNLAINARDAMPAGGKLFIETANVTVDAERVDHGTKLAAGRYVRLSVSDTGTGMSDETLRRAFEPFFTTKETGRGTGLGLSTIYGFVQQAGGSIAIYSEVGHGTTVNIYLPQVDGQNETSSVEPATTTTPMATGERILLVEDNAEVRAVEKAQLEALGYVVTSVSSGPAAIRELADPTRFDLVLSDVVMAGGMSGFDVVRWIQAHAPRLKVLLASGYPDAVLQTEQPLQHRPEILRKPFSGSELARVLRRALDSHGRI